MVPTMPPDSHKISLKIIEAIRQHPVLYTTEVKGSSVKLQEFRQKVWKRISDELGLDPTWVRLRWKNLRDTYCRILKYKNKTEKGVRRKKWIFEDHLSFLKFPYESDYQPQCVELTEEYIQDINAGGGLSSEGLLEQLEDRTDEDYSEYLEILEETAADPIVELDDTALANGEAQNYSQQIQSKYNSLPYRRIRPKRGRSSGSENVLPEGSSSPTISPPRDSPRASPKIPRTDSLKEPHRLSPRDSLKDSHRLSPRDSLKDSHRLSPRDSLKDSHRLSSRDSLKDSHRLSPRDSLKDSHRLSSRDSLRVSPRDSPRDSSRDLSRVSPRDSLRVSPRDSSRDSLRDSSRVSEGVEVTGLEGKGSIELFFESMAQTVKRLPAKAQADIKMNICRIVTEAELRHSDRVGRRGNTQRFIAPPGMIPKLVLIPCNMIDGHNKD